MPTNPGFMFICAKEVSAEMLIALNDKKPRIARGFDKSRK